MVYCTATQVRAICDLTTSDISDVDMTTLIGLATLQLNDDISLKVTEERVERIDKYRENTIDGSNTVFYTKNSYLRYLGDLDDDGSLGTGDALMYEYTSDGTRSALTVSAISQEGKITLSTAPAASSQVTMTYRDVPISIDDPHPLIIQACRELSASMSYGKLEPREYKRLGIRGTSITYTPMGEKLFREKYDATVLKINKDMPTDMKGTDRISPKLFTPGVIPQERY